MKSLFGTDGIRGEAGQFPLDPATVSAIGFSLASHLTERTATPQIVIAVAIDEERAIGVAVKSDSQIRVLADESFTKRVDVKRAAVEVDVSTIRRSIDSDNSGAETCKQEWREC